MENSKIAQEIKRLVSMKLLSQPFRVDDINRISNGLIAKSPSFLSNYCLNNPMGYNAYFKRVGVGLYVLVE